MNSKLFKSQAQDALDINKRGNTFASFVFLGSVIGMVLSFATSLIGGSDAALVESPALAIPSMLLSLCVTIVYTPVYTYGISITALKVLRNEDIAVKDLFSGFSRIGAIIVYNLVTTILTMLGFIAFVIPGIMLTYSYAMGYFILAEHPSVTATVARKKSAEMMKGYRFQLFKLDFSFVGWYILSIFTFGILFFWVASKHQTARAVFYKKLKEIHFGETEHPADAYEAPAAFEQASEPTDYDPDKFSDLR